MIHAANSGGQSGTLFAHAVSCLDLENWGNEVSHIRTEVVAFLQNAEAMTRARRAVAEHARVSSSSPLAWEIITDVIEDLYCRSEEPNQAQDLMALVVTEARRRVQRLRREGNRSIPLDELTEDQEPVIEVDAEAEHRESLLQCIEHARERLQGYPQAAQLLTLYELGVRSRREVLRYGVPEGSYRAARRRMLAALQDAARAVAPELLRRVGRENRLGAVTTAPRKGILRAPRRAAPGGGVARHAAAREP